MSAEKEAIAARLAATREAVLEEIKGLPESDWERPTGVGSWTIRDIVGHLAAGERGQRLLLWLARRSCGDGCVTLCWATWRWGKPSPSSASTRRR